jgi:hypothetical protein
VTQLNNFKLQALALRFKKQTSEQCSGVNLPADLLPITIALHEPIFGLPIHPE